jgi:GR25 family glycosyltransferase involved in LPS biosynthesis
MERTVAHVADIAAFCISLKGSPRRARFTESAATHGVTFEFLDAISPTDLRLGMCIEGCRVDITDLRWTKHENIDPRRRHSPLTFTEIACAYSHMQCWHTAKAQNLDYVCVFEDDAMICRSLRAIDVPDAADIFYLSDRRPANLHGEPVGVGCGTEGYILSRTGILKCLEIFQMLYMPIDLQIAVHQSYRPGNLPGIANCRRENAWSLNARVATNPYCRHPVHNDSQIDPPDVDHIIAERDRLRLEVQALRGSTSWRLTAPARAIRMAFARAS